MANKENIDFKPETIKLNINNANKLLGLNLKEAEIKIIAEIMNQVASAPEDEANLVSCKRKAEKLISYFPLYPNGSFDD